MLENMWFFLGASVATFMGSVLFILAAKKKLVALGFFSSITLALISTFTAVILSNAYSDYKNQDLIESKLNTHISQAETEKTAIKELLSHHTNAINFVLQGQVTANDNLMRLQSEMRTGLPHNLKPIPQRKVAD